MRLLQALNEGKLGVPAELVRQEAQMKKEYLAAKRRRSTHSFQPSRSDLMEYEARRALSPSATHGKQTAIRGGISSRASLRRSPSPDEDSTSSQKGTDGKSPRKRKRQSSSPPVHVGGIQVGGTYDVTSSDVEDEWPNYAEVLSLRLCPDGRKIWGEFCTGIYQGLLLVDPAPAPLRTGVTVEFEWRGFATDTGRNLAGPRICTGDMVFTSATEVEFCFHCMWSEHFKFSGKRIPGSPEVCERGSRSFQLEWSGYMDADTEDYVRLRGWR
ncbi:hypothetical protein LTR66_009988 [Elasticomyces elasticus]|nr:hypothetical protein LTR66_009988 [Elasticomyces elasticus]